MQGICCDPTRVSSFKFLLLRYLYITVGKRSGLMTIIKRLFLILGVGCISYGIARALIVPEVLARQDQRFYDFLAAHTNMPTELSHDVFQLQKQVMMSGGVYPGWPQAIMPVAFGLMLVAASCYDGRKKKDSGRMINAPEPPKGKKF
jgi:hypothetical protein